MSTIPFRSTKVGAAVRSAIGVSVAVPLLLAAMPAVAQMSQQEQMRQLQDQIKGLQGRFDQLKAQQDEQQKMVDEAKTKMAAAQPEEKAKAESGFNVGGTNITLDGYFKLDAIYDFEDDHGTSLGPSDAIATLNTKGTDRPNDDNIGATIKQTRLRLRTTTPTPIGDIGGYVEMDFYNSPYDDSFGGGPSPRVRRAYLTIGNWLIGRDWSTYSDFNYGTMLNFYGPQAQLFERQAQIRYTFQLPDDATFDVALETPTGDGVTTFSDGEIAARQGKDDTVVVDDNGNLAVDPAVAGQPYQTVDNTDAPAPDFAFRYKGAQGSLSFQVAGIARLLKADIQGFNGAASGSNESTFGWGLDVGATWALPTGTTLMGTVSGGEGIGKYIYAPAGGTDTYVTEDGKLDALQRWGYIATISQAITSKLTTNLIWGEAFSESPDNVAFSTAALHDNSSTAAVNLLYTPVDPLTLGIEYNRSYYEQQDGIDATAQNVQFSTIYNF